MNTTTAAATVSDLFGEVISTYTRAQAIANGSLVDLSGLAAEYGVRWPVAITRAAHTDTIAWDDATKPGCLQDETGRAWDVLTMMRTVLPKACAQVQEQGYPGVRVPFRVLRVPATGRGTRPRLAELVLHLGAGDDAEPVITIMLPNED